MNVTVAEIVIKFYWMYDIITLSPVNNGIYKYPDFPNDDFLLSSICTTILLQLAVTVNNNEINTLVNK